MQIFLTSHTKSSSHPSYGREVKRAVHIRQASLSGFTLIELLISVAIIGIITMIVLLKYSSFDSTTLLKGAAYEVALALREAQVKSVSVLRSDRVSEENNPLVGKFDYPYGVSFLPGQKTYTVFRFTDLASLEDEDNPFYGSIDADSPAEIVSLITLERSLQISDLCVTIASGEDCEISRLDISFRRPEFTALFYAPEYDSNEKSISKAKIKVTSTTGSGTFIIEVSRLGQITVTPE